MDKAPLPLLQKCPVSAETLADLLSYEPETGRLFWRERPVELFSNSGRGGRSGEAARWNARYAGTEAFTAISTDGYRHGSIRGVLIGAHRVAWALAHGAWPTQTVDHINGAPADNRLENLRAVSLSENCRNRSIRSDNSSGATGVSWNKRLGKWTASISGEGGRRVHLGVFTDMESAIAARATAAARHGYHQNHGRKP